MIRRLAGCVREFKRPAILTFLFIVLEAVIECFIPLITANLLNALKNGAELSLVFRFGGLLVVMAILSLCCGGIAGYTSAKASAGFARNLRHDVFSRVQTFSFDNIDKFNSASLVTRMTTDVSNVQISFMMLIRIAIRAPLMLVFSIVMAFIMARKLALTFVVIVPVLGCGFFFVAHAAMPAFRRVFRKYDRLNESIEENVRGMRVVKGFAREDYEKEKFGRAAGDIKRDFTHAERIVAINSPLMQSCIYFNLVFILLFGSYLVISSGGSTIDVGQMSAMITYGFQVMMQLMMLTMIFVTLTISAESARRIDEVLREVPTLSNPENPIKDVADGSIDFDAVSFKYSAAAHKDALSDVDLHIQSGMTVGILGGTGAGKSTLVQLIPRLYDVTEGAVRVGGRDVREYDTEALRDAVAMVLQKNLLFSGTIKENLLWGNPDASDEEIAEACRLSQADEFIRTFPEGYETKIEQGGTNVSGGQKQRLCIARALLKRPKILILDDSTSAVDTRTDALIRQGFKEYIPDTTKLIIAQRVASVMDADLICVMENGRIVAAGKHGELLESCDIYREIYEQQTASTAAEEKGVE